MYFRLLLATLLAASALDRTFAVDTGEQVIVVYNSAVPESRQVAEHYAAKRSVPSSQVFGFEMPKTEMVTRAEYQGNLERPLFKKLESTGLWKMRSDSHHTDK